MEPLLLVLVLLALQRSMAFMQQRPSWTGCKHSHALRFIGQSGMVQTNGKGLVQNPAAKSMVKIDPSAAHTYVYKKVFSMSKVDKQDDTLTARESTGERADDPQSTAVVETAAENKSSPSLARTVSPEDTDDKTSPSDSPSLAAESHNVPAPIAEPSAISASESTAPQEPAARATERTEQKENVARTIEPWTWNMVRNMDDNDLQATTLDALGVTARSVALACYGMCDVSAVYRSSSEAAFVTDTINDCAVSLADAARHLSTAVHAASELWTMQVSNSLDAESSMSDQLSVIAGGISEICTNQKVRAPLTELADEALSSTAQIASAVIKSGRIIGLEALRSRKLQQGIHGLSISVPLLGAICAVGALKMVELIDFDNNLPFMRRCSVLCGAFAEVIFK